MIALDFSRAASGSFTNVGTDGGTFDPVGTPLYAQTFPSAVGGTGVGFDDIASDAFEASSATVGDTTTDPIAVFIVFSAAANTAVQNLATKRDNSSGAGWEIRASAAGVLTMLIEDEDNESGTAVPATSPFDGTARYAGMRVDIAGDTIYGWHDASVSEASGAIAGTLVTATSANPVRIGDDQRSAFGDGGGLVRYFYMWRGASALLFTKTTADALFAELTP